MNQLLARIHPKLPFLFRYGVSGGIGAGIQVLADIVMIDIFSADLTTAVVTGFLFALAATFLLQKYWTFKEHSRERAKRQFILYTTIALLSLLANVFLMHFFVGAIEIHYVFAQILTVGVVSGTSFLFHNFVTFKHSDEVI